VLLLLSWCNENDFQGQSCRAGASLLRLVGLQGLLCSQRPSDVACASFASVRAGLCACMHGQAAAVHPMSRKRTRRATITEPDAQSVQNTVTMVIDAHMTVMQEIMVIMGGSFSMRGTRLQQW
jgi:hypothetical protein